MTRSGLRGEQAAKFLQRAFSTMTRLWSPSELVAATRFADDPRVARALVSWLTPNLLASNTVGNDVQRAYSGSKQPSGYFVTLRSQSGIPEEKLLKEVVDGWT